MKRILLVALSVSSLASAMDKIVVGPDSKQILRQVYRQHMMAYVLKKPTVDFMQMNPEANESKVLQRYVDAVVKNAELHREQNPNYRLNTIGLEILDAMNATPYGENNLNWILKGEDPAKRIHDCTIYASECKKKIEEIEASIAKK